MSDETAGPRGGERDEEEVQLLDARLFGDVLARARVSPRLRQNHNLHRRLDDPLSRLLNVLVRGTYITPHRHLTPPKAETFIVLEGRIAFFVFDGAGRVRRRVELGPGAEGGWGIDLAPGVWHTLAALTPHAVCFECKPGPYRALDDKEMAPWAPREGQPGAAAYLEGLLADPGG